MAARPVLSHRRLPHGRGDGDGDGDDLRNSWRGLHVNVNGRLPPRRGDGGDLQHNRCGFHEENVNEAFLPSSQVIHCAGGGRDDDVNGDNLPGRPGGGDYESDGLQASSLYRDSTPGCRDVRSKELNEPIGVELGGRVSLAVHMRMH